MDGFFASKKMRENGICELTNKHIYELKKAKNRFLYCS